ncbi:MULTISPECIES: alpha-ketoacid dehydrogenase subunit alpha/beta [Petrimonas]|jgi:2-oxoisovalerate dehydrogenase E1 component|uniref:Acetoin:2,6-dichlorophenolindophenol oxidoreductase subunit beta n=1 Tax=Petrimonas mucosa TaxID=1642646 RepID=A0A1G4G626_9BACT|nr:MULTISPECIES: alpha-ketoacid dehydrogenase subunit alpha/beta [Petrimonas]MDD3560458.1 thiamine pyrophosphate-dependent enzyme [Petrimonas mucosa]SCM57046.1 Acetoin:2,6-dichlorophenolindophenol oxidoreductase subunit beta [Petrimonas mucosa]SFU50062.1 2-oxoisovalerate dehydrogenase E1 component [Porphyromonadaceae bacterium KHP3R9]HHT29747.1 dehydrogenase [Petrimonas mucosa]
MPKSQFIDPAEARKPGVVEFQPIPVNQYQKTVKEERGNFTDEELKAIYHDMVLIREFETMLNLIKTKGEYNGVAYNHPGPAHLSIGQESAAVGMAWTLTVDDFIFGSHRSHGEILAKGMSAIHKLSDEELMKIMQEFFDGTVLKIVQKDFNGTTKELARRFLVYGTLAEIFARETGFNKGLGGSMHAFFTPFGVYPNNAIVGGSGDIAVGAALYKKVNRKPGLVVANIGDASMACGPVWEGITFAAMDQFRELWEGEMQGGLPVIINIMNNQYGMGGQTCGETMGYGIAARIGAGVNDEQMHAERVDGYNPLAVIDAYRRKRKVIEEKKGPVLLDVLTYRYSGHSPSDASSYRTKEEVEAWERQDCIASFGKQLLEAGVATQDELDAVWSDVKALTHEMFLKSIDDEISPRMKNPDVIGEMMFSNGSVDSFSDAKPDVLMPLEENSRVKKIATKERFAFDADGKPFSKMKQFQLRDAIFEAIMDRFYKDASLIAYGEENRDWGGAFAVYGGMTEALPYHRLFNSPISEASIVGTAIGYAMCGGRVIPEIMYCDFLGRCGDEVFNQLPKWQAMSGNVLKMPVVLRVSVGSKYGAQHSQDWTSLVAHIPGIKVCFPVTPYDAKGLMNAALQGTDPVIFFESQRIYDIGEQFHKGGVPTGYYEIPIGEPDVKREGKDITFLTIGHTLYPALQAAKELETVYGMSAEVIDARSLVPFNYEKVIASVKKTGKIIVAGDATARGSFLNDLAANISSLCFDYLDAPVGVLGSRNWITPAHELESAFFPQPSWFIDMIHERIQPLNGYIPGENFTDAEMIRRAKKGV